MSKQKIRVLLVDDSPLALHILAKIIDQTSDIAVAGCAQSGKQALKMIGSLQPDVVCTDFHMPEMDGLALVRQIMTMYPRPVLVVSVSVSSSSNNVFQLLEAGALDIVTKPRMEDAGLYDGISRELLDKIRIVAGVHVFRKKISELERLQRKNLHLEKISSQYRLLVIGASTGGPQALLQVLSQLPANFPLAIVCIQHISEGFLHNFIDWLAEKCVLPCLMAQGGEIPLAGRIYFPQERQHLEFDMQGRFHHTSDVAYQGHCPSISITMQSAARALGKNVIATLLTGMGHDGADGMLAVRQAGGVTIAQDAASSIVYGMPKQAVALGAAEFVLPIDEIATQLIHLCQSIANHEHT